MADPAKGEPTRTEVFAYLDSMPGYTSAHAVAYFGAQGREIDGSKIRKWLSRRRKAATREATSRAREAFAATSGRNRYDGDEERILGGRVHKAVTDIPLSRAHETRPPLTKPIQRTAANLTEPARVKLRRAVDQQLDFLSDPDTVPLQKDRADAARALTSLLLGCPDILTFEDRTSGKDRTVGENAEAAQLAAVFEVQSVG